MKKVLIANTTVKDSLKTDSMPLKMYKIKNHDSGKTYKVKAVNYTDAKTKYSKHILKDADKSMGAYNGYSIKQNADGDIYVLKKSGEKEFFESWKKAYEAIKSGAIKDSLTKDAEMAGWIAIYNGTRIEIAKSEAGSLYAAKKLAILKFKEKFKHVKEHMISIAPGYNDSLTEDADLTVGYSFTNPKDATLYTVVKFKKMSNKSYIALLKNKQGKYYLVYDLTHTDYGTKFTSSKQFGHDADYATSMFAHASVQDSTITDKLVGNGEVHFTYKGGRVITGVWNKNKLSSSEILNILNKYNCRKELASWNDVVFSTRIGNEENLCKAFNEINPSYTVSELMSLHDSITEDSMRDAVKTFTIRWRNTTDRVISKDIVTASSLSEALRKVANQDENFGVGTSNMVLISASSDTGTYQISGNFTELIKRNIDSLTKDAVIYGEWQSLLIKGVWYVNTNDLQKTKQELKSAGCKYESHITNLKGMLYKYTVQYTKDSLTEDADIAQNDIKETFLPEDANADNIKYIGFNELRKISFYEYDGEYFAHHDLTGQTEKVDKDQVQKILKKNLLGEIDENEDKSDTDEEVRGGK